MVTEEHLKVALSRVTGFAHVHDTPRQAAPRDALAALCEAAGLEHEAVRMASGWVDSWVGVESTYAAYFWTGLFAGLLAAQEAANG